MGAARRLKQERESRRSYILEAARKLFATRGVESTTMEALAAEAGYTRRTLYAYFRSREEILLSVLTADLESRWALQEKAVARGSTGMEKLRLWAGVLHEASRQSPQTLRLQVYLDFRGISRKRVRASVFSAFKAVNEELAEGLREIFRQGIADGSMRKDLRVDLCISNFLESLRAVLHRAFQPTYSFARLDPAACFSNYLDLFCRAVGSPDGESHAP